MYEDHHEFALADLAERLKCKPKDVRPCLYEAFNIPGDVLERDARFTHALLYFVGAELLTIMPTTTGAKRAFYQWARERGIPQERITGLLDWFAKSKWGRRGCSSDKQLKRICCSRRNCGWFSRGPWKAAAARTDLDLQEFYRRGWPEELVARFGKRLGGYATRLYLGLVRFEVKHGIKAGSKLFFTRQAGLDFCDGLRPSIQQEALVALRSAGLVRVPCWGRPRTKGKANQPRVVQRVNIPLSRS